MFRALPRRGRLGALTLAASALTVVGIVGLAAPAQAAPAPSKIAITALSSTSTSKVVKGDELTLSGWTSANLRNQVLQAYVVRGTSTAALNIATRVNASSRFAVTIPVNQSAGAVKYVLKFAGSRTLASATAVQGVNVWEWFPLTGQRIADAGEVLGNGAPSARSNVAVGGKTYSTAIATGGLRGSVSSWSEWNLGYHCAAFSTLVGLTDKSSSAAVARTAISTDGTSRVSRDVRVGAPTNTWFDVSGAFRLRIDAQSIATETGYVAYPYAKVLCSSNPGPKS